MDDKVIQSYAILDKLRLDHGLYVASAGSLYQYVWLRDTFYEVLPYLDKDCGRYEQTYHTILDIFKKYEWKLDIHTKQKPQYKHEYMHPRYTKDTLEEINVEWGNAQHDATGAILFGIGEGERMSKRILRDEKDREIVQKLVQYLECCEYWKDLENGMWEEWPEVHSSSLGACVAGLRSVKSLVDVPEALINKGYNALIELLPYESQSRHVDLAQLSLVYPFGVLPSHLAENLVNRVILYLEAKKGVIRYRGDSYYAVPERERDHLNLEKYYDREAEWTMGFPWLALCCLQFGDTYGAEEYIKKAEKVMLPDGSLPELYYSKSDEYNENKPLGWANAMYILAKERFLKKVNNQ